MTAKIDNVKKGERITAEAWNELVERVNALERKQTFNFTVQPRPKAPGGVVVGQFLARETPRDSGDDAYPYIARCWKYDEENGGYEKDKNGRTKIVEAWFCSLNTTNLQWRTIGAGYPFVAFWNANKNRWECPCHFNYATAISTSSNVYDEVLAVDETSDGYNLHFNGVCCLRVFGAAQEARGRVFLASKHFKYDAGGGDDIVGDELYIKTKAVRVVTDVVDGVPKFAYVNSVGDK